MSAAGHHVVTPGRYLIIFGSLMALTALTTAIAYVDLGALNTVIALGIAVVKAALVILYFMHLRQGPSLLWIAVLTGFYWLFILLGTVGDYLTRDWLAPADW